MPTRAQETLCSLRFAAKVNQCETAAKGGAQRNVSTMEWGSGVAALVSVGGGGGRALRLAASSSGQRRDASNCWRVPGSYNVPTIAEAQPGAAPPLQTGRPSLAPTDAEARRMSTAAGGVKRKPGLPPNVGAPRGIPRPRLG